MPMSVDRKIPIVDPNSDTGECINQNLMSVFS